MRLLWAVFLVVSLSGSDIERALSVARARDSERQQFHSRYMFDLKDPVVTQIEVTTEFRRLVLIAEDHVGRGDFMFTRGLREAQQAIAPFRGLITLRAQVRFSPLNTFIVAPPYEFAIGGSLDLLGRLDTEVTPQFSIPFKDNRTGKDLSSLIGATLGATLSAERTGQSPRVIAVMLDGKEIAHVTVDFGRLD